MIKQQRIAYLDIVGGLCIFHICISHMVQDVGLESNLGGGTSCVFLVHGMVLL